MKIVISPDSFKGSMTASQAGQAMARACNDIFPNETHVLKPMADGGEGTLDTLLFSTKGKRFQVRCTGPLGKEISSQYGVLGDGKTAVIETALVAGLTQIPKAERDPYFTTSFGLGELIQTVIHSGYESVLIGLGGSATNDGGLGMLQALGAEFFDRSGKVVSGYGRNVADITAVDFSKLDPKLKEVSIQVASDVENPLCGEKGASYIYGPQKGATSDQVLLLDKALDRYSDLVEGETGLALKGKPGAGAAGGLGFALMTIGAELVSGAELVGKAIGLEAAISQADLVITGEGQSDEQTLYGKAPGYVADLAKQFGIETLLLSGGVSGGYDALHQKFAGCFSITRGPASLQECMNSGEQLLYEQTKNVLHVIRSLTK